MPRIIAGRLGGRTIEAPPGRGTRPTSDRVREALFSRLETELDLVDAAVLDLYAGSGALGLEAASRGAGLIVLVDSDRAAVAACRRNIASLGLHDAARVEQRTAARWFGQPTTTTFELVLIDPPYDLAESELAAVLAGLVEGRLDRDSLVVVERSSRSPEPTWPAGLNPYDHRRYGETTLWFAEHPEPSAERP